MNTIVTQSAKLWAKIAVCTVISFFVILSMTLIFTAFFTENIGYNVYTVDENGERENLYTYYYTDGEDLKLKEYEDKNIGVKTEIIRSDLKGAGSIVYAILTQLICVSILVIFIFVQLKNLGKTDSNDVKYCGISEDKFKGLKIGFFTALPFIVFYFVHIAFAFIKPDFTMAYYRLVNYIFFPVLNIIFDSNNVAVGDLNIIQYILVFLPLLVVPATAHISYILGYKKIEFSNNFIYQKEKKEKG